MNILRTAFLMALLTALFVFVGYLIGGKAGMLIAFGVAAVMNIVAYWNSDKAVLAMYRAQEVDEHSAPELVGLVRQLSEKAGLPMPKVYIADNPQPNAFATGRSPSHAAVCATSGILDRLSKEELAGVLAHELSHVKNRDTLTMTITATLAGAVSMLANFAFFMGGSRRNPLGIIGVILVAVLAPLAAALVQMAISRQREYEADHSGALLSGRPLWLASALKHIESASQRIENADAEAHPATAHMFIINPLWGSNWQSLFSTHPPTGERIARLQAMAAEMGDTGGGTMSTEPQRPANQGPWG